MHIQYHRPVYSKPIQKMEWIDKLLLHWAGCSLVHFYNGFKTTTVAERVYVRVQSHHWDMLQVAT